MRVSTCCLQRFYEARTLQGGRLLRGVPGTAGGWGCVRRRNNLCRAGSMWTAGQGRSIWHGGEGCNLSVFFQSMKVRRG